MNGESSERLNQFLGERKRLLRLAYRYLGAVAEAEDVVQEAWLRFSKVDAVEDCAGLLATIVSRICLDRLKSAQARRETYVGQWLPEPATTAIFEPAEDRALDISFAVMRALERLSPTERAAYFLHDLWDVPFDEIATILSRTPEACRKLASRARKSLASGRKRFSPSAAEVVHAAEIFRQSVEDADPARLIAMFASDAELISDGGGKVTAAPNIVFGAANVGRFLFGFAAKQRAGDIEHDIVMANDQPVIILRIGGMLDQVLAFDLDVQGKIATVYIVRNPGKLVSFAAMETFPSHNRDRVVP